eukprot:sb/3472506/
MPFGNSPRKGKIEAKYSNPATKKERLKCEQLLPGLPSLEIAILDTSQQRYYPFPGGPYSSWGHDIVTNWMGSNPKDCGTFYQQATDQEVSKGIYLPYPPNLPLMYPPRSNEAKHNKLGTGEINYTKPRKHGMLVARSSNKLCKIYVIKNDLFVIFSLPGSMPEGH